MTDLSSIANVYTDFQGLGELRTAARNNSSDATKETAHQFEALFVQTMLKSMRQATPGDSLAGSDQANMYRDMYDKQLSMSLVESGGIGLAKIIEQQLQSSKTGIDLSKPENPKKSVDTPKSLWLTPAVQTRHSQPPVNLAFASQIWRSNQEPKIPLHQSNAVTGKNWGTPSEFISALTPAANKAAQALGTEPEAVLAIAALETGWGQHIAQKPNGESSFNLFGIKSTNAQPKVLASTSEYINGRMQKMKEHFRSYENPVDSVSDFVTFIQNNKRYQQALSFASEPEAFIREIHKAGYATDPNYTEKVVGVMRQIKLQSQETGNATDINTKI